MVTFYVVRHGETEANKNGVLQGHLDTPLSPEGIKQARIVAKALLPINLEAVYSSDLSRARETAHALMEGRSCALILDKRLREINFGSLTGLTSEEARERFPEYHAQLAKDPYHARHPGGESRMDLRERVSRVLDDIYEWNKDKGDVNVGIVSHGGVISAISSLASPGGEWPASVVNNCSVTILVRDESGLRAVKVNDCSHMTALGEGVCLPSDRGEA